VVDLQVAPGHVDLSDPRASGPDIGPVGGGGHLVLGGDVGHRLIEGDVARPQVPEDGLLVQEIQPGRGGGGQGAEGLLGLGLAVVTGQVEARVDQGGGGRDVAHATAQREALLVAVAVVAQGDVVPAAIQVAELAREPCGGFRAEVERRGGLQVDQVVAAIGRGGIAVGSPAQGGLLGDVVDGAAGGVAAEQRVLGPAQHLDALHVEQAERAGVRRVHGHVVHVRAHRGRGVTEELVRADASNHDVLAQGVLDHDVQVGRELDDAGNGLHLHALELPAGKGLHGHRHVLEGLLALLRGDGDLFQQVDRLVGLVGLVGRRLVGCVGVLRLLRSRRPNPSQEQHQRQIQERRSVEPHVPPD
jgi:hypothetical protein